jgi:hypothetical protein
MLVNVESAGATPVTNSNIITLTHSLLLPSVFINQLAGNRDKLCAPHRLTEEGDAVAVFGGCARTIVIVVRKYDSMNRRFE